MSDAGGDGWQYTASYRSNRQFAAAIGRSVGSLVLPMPSWMRALTVRCLLTRTTLRADARGISGGCGPLSADAAGPCPWSDVTDIVIWQYNYLRIIGIARRGDSPGYVAADKATGAIVRVAPPERSLQGGDRTTRRARHKAHEKLGPPFPEIMAPDGTPCGVGSVLTTNGRSVDLDQLVAATQRFAPHVQVTDLSAAVWPPLVNAPAPGRAMPFEYLASWVELIGWRRSWWALGVALSSFVLFSPSTHLGPALRVAVGGLALLLLIGRALVVRRRRWRTRHAAARLASRHDEAPGLSDASPRRGRFAVRPFSRKGVILSRRTGT
jgi:hypothetical protein